MKNDIFDTIQIESNPSEVKKSGGDIFDQIPHSEPEEGFWKSATRYATQIPQAYAETTAPGIIAGVWQALAQGEILDPEEIEHIKMISEREGIPFDEDAYLDAAEKALGGIPTVSNIASKTEEKTGIPLEPKTRGQKGLRFLTQATRLSPKGGTFRGLKTGLPKPVLGAGVAATKEIAQELGVPEPVAELGSFGILKTLPTGSKSLSIGKETKPSGMTTQRFEKLEKPTKVSESKIKGINEGIETEFRGIANEIIEKSPIEETHTALKEQPEFKNQVRESFKKVEELAENIPEKVSTADLKKDLSDSFKKEKGTGFLASEYEKNYKKFLNQFIKETPTKEATVLDYVKQYRKNNAAYGEIKEPGQSNAYNRAKRDALRDYNIAIADTFEKKFPGSEFSNLFKSTNDKWSKIMDAESINNFMDDLFDGKINFKMGEKLLEKEGMKYPFKRALGEEGFKEFEQLTKDLMSKEQAHKMMKVAETKGYGDLAKTGLAYVINPNLGYLKMGIDVGKITYKKIWESLLDKPQLAVKWDKGVQAFKKGDFATAEKQFNILNKEIGLEEKRVESLKKFNEKKAPKNINEAFKQMGQGISENLYNGIFDSLEKGKKTFAGIKDPLLEAARPAYEAGQIKSVEDLKNFSDFWKKSLKNKP